MGINLKNVNNNEILEQHSHHLFIGHLIMSDVLVQLFSLTILRTYSTAARSQLANIGIFVDIMFDFTILAF